MVPELRKFGWMVKEINQLKKKGYSDNAVIKIMGRKKENPSEQDIAGSAWQIEFTHITHCQKCNARVNVECRFNRENPIEVKRKGLINLFTALEDQKIQNDVILNVIKPFWEKYLKKYNKKE